MPAGVASTLLTSDLEMKRVVSGPAAGVQGRVDLILSRARLKT